MDLFGVLPLADDSLDRLPEPDRATGKRLMQQPIEAVSRNVPAAVASADDCTSDREDPL